MNNNERFKLIKEIKDAAVKTYDQLRFYERYNENNNREVSKIMNNIAAMLELIDELSLDFFTSFCPVVVTEDITINDDETLEIKTGISNLSMTDDATKFIFSESFSNSGHLTFFQKFENDKIKIFGKNETLKNLRDNDYYDPTITSFYEPGSYQIKKNSIIGICITKEKKATHNDNNKRLFLNY